MKDKDVCPVNGETRAEEFVSALTHGLGLVLSVIGIVVILVVCWRRGGALQLTAHTVYGIGLILCYLSSTLYHACKNVEWKHRLRVLDHAAIFVVIAATYTPFMMISLGNRLGYSVLGVVWAMALAGVLFKFYSKSPYAGVTVLAYLAMGWMVVVVAGPLAASLPGQGMAWLVSGGLAYTAGVGFYAWTGLPFNHAIWHLFVMAGSICHYFSLLFSVAPW